MKDTLLPKDYIVCQIWEYFEDGSSLIDRVTLPEVEFEKFEKKLDKYGLHLLKEEKSIDMEDWLYEYRKGLYKESRKRKEYRKTHPLTALDVYYAKVFMDGAKSMYALTDQIFGKDKLKAPKKAGDVIKFRRYTNGNNESK